MNKFSILVFTIIICSSKLFADATPKINDRPELEFWKNDQQVTVFDSLLITTYLQDSIELLYPSLYRSDFDMNVLYNYGTNYLIDERTQIDSFNIFIIHNGIHYQSTSVYLIGDRSFLKFNLTDKGEIQKNHNLLYCKWHVYLKSLLITILFEFVIILLFLKRWKESIYRFFIYAFLINFLTHFSLWYFDSHYDLSLILLEIIVLIFESSILALIFRNEIPFTRTIWVIVLANIFSWWFGSIFHWFLIMWTS